MYHGSHNTTILASLNSDRQERDSFCDVTLVVDGRRFPAHRCILAKLSPFFSKMFKSKMKENYNSTANIHGVVSDVMEIVLNFLYTASVDITEENVFELFLASDYLQLDELKDLCATFLIDSVDATNCLQYLIMSQTYCCAQLTDGAAKIAALHFEDIKLEENLHDMNKLTLLSIMEHVDQNEINGELMFERAVAWVQHDYEQRKVDFVHLVKIIDFNKLPVSFMKRVLADEALVKESHDCKDYFLNLLFNRMQVDGKEEAKNVPDKPQAFEDVQIDGGEGVPALRANGFVLQPEEELGNVIARDEVDVDDEPQQNILEDYRNYVECNPVDFENIEEGIIPGGIEAALPHQYDLYHDPPPPGFHGRHCRHPPPHHFAHPHHPPPHHHPHPHHPRHHHPRWRGRGMRGRRNWAWRPDHFQ